MPSLTVLIVAYLAIGWVFGVILFCCLFIHKDRSMGGNAGTCPLDFYEVELPSVLGSVMFLLACLLWPLSLVILTIVGIIKLFDYLATSENHAIPRFIRFIFAWPFYVLMDALGQNVDVDR